MTTKRIALIDGDVAKWIFSYYAKDLESIETEGIDNWIQGILYAVKADEYVGFLEGSQVQNFRKVMFSDYKATRPVKPDWFVKHSSTVETHLVNKWNFQIVEGIEVDDAVASAAMICTDRGELPIVCSSDKDLIQVPGIHYNPKTGEHKSVTPEMARKVLYEQIVSGDSTDNIKGIPGIGKVNAERLIKTYGTPFEVYTLHYPDPGLGIAEFAENAIKVVLKRDKYFQFSTFPVPPLNIKQNDVSKLFED